MSTISLVASSRILEQDLVIPNLTLFIYPAMQRGITLRIPRSNLSIFFCPDDYRGQLFDYDDEPP